jgi:protease I
MKLKGRSIAVLIEDQYEDQELWYPVLRLKEEGARVTIIGPKAQNYGSKHGYPAKADLAASEARVDDYDAVIIPGGYAPDRMRRDPAMVKLVADADKKKKVVAAICHAGWMLTSADIVRGRKVTGFFSIKDDLVHAGARFEDAEVVVDGNLVTSRTPADLPAFSRAIIAALSSSPVPAASS